MLCTICAELRSSSVRICPRIFRLGAPQSDLRGAGHSVVFWYDGPEAATNAVGYAKFYSRSRQTVIAACFQLLKDGFTVLDAPRKVSLAAIGNFTTIWTTRCFVFYSPTILTLFEHAVYQL